MRRKVRHSKYLHHRLPRRSRRVLRWLWLLGVLGAVAAYWYVFLGGTALYAPGLLPITEPTAKPGDVLGVDEVKTYTTSQAAALARQNYGGAAQSVRTG